MITATRPRRRSRTSFAGWPRLARLQLRRDRMLLAIWALSLGALPFGIVSATRIAYPDQAAMEQFAAGTVASPSQLALRGPIFEVSVGGLTAWTVASSASLINALVALLITIRYTRTEEQSGRLELIGARRVGRLAPLTAGIVVPALTSAVIGVLVTLGMLAQRLPVAGSFLLGAMLACAGWVFVGIGSIAAQCAESSGGARSIGLVALGVCFALAAVGDLTSSPLVWFTPIGWSRHAQAFAGDHGWVTILPLLSTLALCSIAAVLASGRDLGHGLVPVRPGRPRATRRLTGSMALSWRLQRGQLIGWAAGLGALGLLLGSVIGGVSEQLDSPAFRDLSARMGGDGNIGQMFFQFVVYVLAQVTSAAALASVLALRSHETSGLAEMILVRPVSRTRWAAGQLLVSSTLAVVVLSAIGLGAGVSSGQLPGMLGTTLAYAPAVAVIVAAATALIGWLPRIATPAGWTLLAVIIVMDLFAEFGLIGPGLMRLSPYAATFEPVITGAPLALPLTVLTVIAVALTAFGLVGLSRRDLGQ